MDFRLWLESDDNLLRVVPSDIWGTNEEGEFKVYTQDEHQYDLGPLSEFVRKHSPKLARLSNHGLMKALQDLAKPSQHAQQGDQHAYILKSDDREKIVGFIVYGKLPGYQRKDDPEGRDVVAVHVIMAEDAAAARRLLLGLFDPLRPAKGSQILAYVDFDNKPVLNAIKSMGIWNTSVEGDKVVAQFPAEMEKRPPGAAAGFTQRVKDPLSYHFGDEDEHGF
jgi:hypothetical protein